MLDIVLISFGKMKDKNFNAASQEYLKRLAPYAKIRLEELAAEPFNSESDKLKAKRKEGERLAAALDKYPEAEIFILDENGAESDSRKFSEVLESGERRKLVFAVGGSLGISADILAAGYGSLSLSKMTLPHELAKVVLLEQIYRGLAIIRGKQYHH